MQKRNILAHKQRHRIDWIPFSIIVWLRFASSGQKHNDLILTWLHMQNESHGLTTEKFGGSKYIDRVGSIIIKFIDWKRIYEFAWAQFSILR